MRVNFLTTNSHTWTWVRATIFFLEWYSLDAKSGFKCQNEGQGSNLPKFGEKVCRELLLNTVSPMKSSNLVGRFVNMKTRPCSMTS